MSKLNQGSAASSGEPEVIPHRTGEGPRFERLPRKDFPTQPVSSNKQLPATQENFAWMLDRYGITVRFDLLKKRVDVSIPGFKPSYQNRDEAVLAQLESLSVLNDMPPANVRRYLLPIADKAPVDPFADWVGSKPWDQKRRVWDFTATITPAEDYDTSLARTLILKWLTSIVAATYKGNGFRARGVLTLQGGQGLGKTTWIANLIPASTLQRETILTGFSWDGGSKDARLNAIRHRIVELGELEGSFRREISSLKAFITQSIDKIRPPYGRVEAEYPRTTIFAATVNDPQFLTDATGNSRFWTIAVESIDYEHGFDMQQVFAELKVMFEDGNEWWLSPADEQQLAAVNRQHRVQTSMDALISEAIDPEGSPLKEFDKLTAREVLEQLGIDKPTNQQFKDANAALKTLLGEPKRSRGLNRWEIPWSRDHLLENNVTYNETMKKTRR